MSTTFTCPDGVDLTVTDEVVCSPSDANAMAGTRMTAWCASQGLDAFTIPSAAFVVTRSADGALTAHFRTFVLGDDARWVPAARPRDGHSFLKHGWQSRPVSSLPTDFPAPTD